MSSLSPCQQCHGFVPAASERCVHCGAPMGGLEPRGSVMMKGLVALAGAGVAAITLMACYGMPPCDTPAPDGSNDPWHCYGPRPCDELTLDGSTPAPDSGDPYYCYREDGGSQPSDGGTDAGR